MSTSLRDIPSGPLWDILIYQWPDGALELKGDTAWETIWASLDQIATLFERDKSVISRHIRNIFKDEELSRDWTVAFFTTVQSEGGRMVSREIEYFNLDMILSIWYRINSKVATTFRQRATQTLKQHITQWFTINNKSTFLDTTFTHFISIVLIWYLVTSIGYELFSDMFAYILEKEGQLPKSKKQVGIQK